MSILEKLKQLEKESQERNIPIIGSVKGKWLLNKVKELQPQTILELGTANGYSGIILGSGGAKLITIDLDSRIVKEAEENFSKFGIKAEIVIGNAETEIKKLNKQFDLIFIDHSKKSYLAVLEDCIKLGEVIIADNINLGGCKDFKAEILNHSKLKTELIDIGDSLSYSIVDKK